MLIGDHPFKGNMGEVVRIGDTAIGKRPVIKLDGVIDGIEGHEVYVLRSKQASELKGKKKRGDTKNEPSDI